MSINCKTGLYMVSECDHRIVQNTDLIIFFFFFGTGPLNLCISPTESYLPVAARLRTSHPWSFLGIISRSALDWWMASSRLAAACSLSRCLSSWEFCWILLACTTPCGSSASLCLFCSWLDLHTNPLFLMPKTRREEKRECSDSLLKKRFAISLFSKFSVTESGLLGSQLHFLDTLCLMFTW